MRKHRANGLETRKVSFGDTFEDFVILLKLQQFDGSFSQFDINSISKFDL